MEDNLYIDDLAELHARLDADMEVLAEHRRARADAELRLAQIDGWIATLRAEAVVLARDLVIKHKLQTVDVWPPRRRRAEPPRAVRNPATGRVWRGYGLQPLWVTKLLAQGEAPPSLTPAAPGEVVYQLPPTLRHLLKTSRPARIAPPETRRRKPADNASS